MTLSNGVLSVNAGRHALTYFTSPGSFQSIAPNASIQVTFDLSFTQVGTSNSGFRVGLFDSNGATRPSSNGTSTGFYAYDGYVFSWNPTAGSDNSNGLKLNARTGGSESSLQQLMSTISNTANYSVVGEGDVSGNVFKTSPTYQATYTISRGNSDGLNFEFGVTGGTLVSFTESFSIVAPSTYAFDAFAIFSVSGSTGSNFVLDNFRVTHAVGSSSSPPPPPPPSSGSVGTFDLGGGAIPEPSTYAACAGAAVLGLAFWRRRRAAAKALAA